MKIVLLHFLKCFQKHILVCYIAVTQDSVWPGCHFTLPIVQRFYCSIVAQCIPVLIRFMPFDRKTLFVA